MFPGLLIIVITLVAMPGAGKSSVGAQLARRLGWTFEDTDVSIERRIGESVRSYFERAGEDSFRQIEAEVLDASLRGGGDRIVATGGGAVLLADNRRVLRTFSTVIYLRASPEELFRRLRKDTRRPLLQVADPRARLRELYRQREPLYRETAHYVIETGRPSLQALVGMILMQLELAGIVDPNLVPSPVEPRV